jgi:hypothetical protein
MRSTTRRGLALVAVLAQVAIVFAPLVEVHDAQAGRTSAGAIPVPSRGAAIGAQQNHRPPHNPTTCPACIAQSLHAQQTSNVRIPTLAFAERGRLELRTAIFLGDENPSTHRSRAPPLVS